MGTDASNQMIERLQTVLTATQDSYELALAEIERLQAALRDCMSYVDCDNLTQQYKHQNWQRVLDGGEWVTGNVKVTGV